MAQLRGRLTRSSTGPDFLLARCRRLRSTGHMPKSRGRRPRQHSADVQRRQRRQQYDEAQALRRGTASDAVARLSPVHRFHMRATADAELRGDPAEALRHYAAIPMFSASLHLDRLRQLVEFGEDAPGWVWSRWLTVQTRRPLWTGSTSAAGPDPALLATLEAVYPDGIDPSYLEDTSLEVFLTFLHERDWVLRQLAVYEHAGLRELVEQFAGPRLLERADRAQEWVEAPMGAYRLDSDENGDAGLWLTDLGTGRRVEVLDLGLATEHSPGTHLLGRLVPITQPPHRMFEWRPLSVDPDTARAVADRPAEWLSTLATRAHAGLLPPMFSYRDDDDSMLSDLPSRCWLGLLDPADVSRLPAPDGLIDYDDAAMFVLGKLLRAVPKVPLGIAAARDIAEALLVEPGLHARIRREFGSRRFAPAWRLLAGIVRDPARSRCLRFAEPGADAWLSSTPA